MQRFNLTVPVGSSNLRINTIQPNSSILLNANGNEMMRITSVATTGNNNTGQVLIQPGLTDSFPLINLGGSIRFSQPIALGPIVTENTIIYGYTNAQSTPTGDGFRLKFKNNAQGFFNDCLIFEKTDANNNNPDGCTRFTNTGNDGIEELAMTIEGDGHIGVGFNFTQALHPWRRFSVFDSLRPQLRLLNRHANHVNLETYTDFETTTNGDLRIDPRRTSGALRTVFINYGTGNSLPATFPGIGLNVNGQTNI